MGVENFYSSNDFFEIRFGEVLKVLPFFLFPYVLNPYIAIGINNKNTPQHG